MHGTLYAVRCTQQQTIPLCGRRDDRVTAVHVDGGWCAVLSAAVLLGAATPVGKSAHTV